MILSTLPIFPISILLGGESLESIISLNNLQSQQFHLFNGGVMIYFREDSIKSHD